MTGRHYFFAFFFAAFFFFTFANTFSTAILKLPGRGMSGVGFTLNMFFRASSSVSGMMIFGIKLGGV